MSDAFDYAVAIVVVAGVGIMSTWATIELGERLRRRLRRRRHSRRERTLAPVRRSRWF